MQPPCPRLDRCRLHPPSSPCWTHWQPPPDDDPTDGLQFLVCPSSSSHSCCSSSYKIKTKIINSEPCIETCLVRAKKFYRNSAPDGMLKMHTNFVYTCIQKLCSSNAYRSTTIMYTDLLQQCIKNNFYAY
jgi:hypothetical protein